jgi:hypothetical protein
MSPFIRTHGDLVQVQLPRLLDREGSKSQPELGNLTIR